MKASKGIALGSVAALALAGIVPALAIADPTADANGKVTGADEHAHAGVQLEKVYRFSDELAPTAAADFTWTFEPYGYGVAAGEPTQDKFTSREVDTNAVSLVPTVGTMQFEYANFGDIQTNDAANEYVVGGNTTAASASAWAKDAAEESYTRTASISDLFIAPTVSEVDGEQVVDWSGSTFPHAGIYCYKVTESTQYADNSAKATHNDDKSIQFVSFYVYNDGTVDVVIEHGDVDEDGELVEDSLAKADKIAWDNEYEKLTDANITKEFSGALADLTLEVPVDITLTLPPSANGEMPDSHTANVNGTPVNFVQESEGSSVYKAEKVLINHEGKIEIKDIPVGTVIKVNEIESDLNTEYTDGAGSGVAISGYTPSIAYQTVTYTGTGAVDAPFVAAAADSAKQGEEDTDLDVEITAADITREGLDKANDIAYTNTYNQVTPTGIALAAAPWAALVALLGIGAAVVVRRRREGEEM